MPASFERLALPLLRHGKDEPSTLMHVMVGFGYVRYPFSPFQLSLRAGSERRRRMLGMKDPTLGIGSGRSLHIIRNTQSMWNYCHMDERSAA